jgi:hypothetical protein
MLRLSMALRILLVVPAVPLRIVRQWAIKVGKRIDRKNRWLAKLLGKVIELA